MGSYANRSAAAQMERDGIRTLPRWSKPKRGIGCSVQRRLDHGECGHAGCSRDARYATPVGNRCYDHAIQQRSTTTSPDRMENR